MASLLLRSLEQESVVDINTISPLPSVLRRGMVGFVILGLASFLLALALFARLTYRMLCKPRLRLHRNQFYVLIINLLIADLLQSTAFLLNADWLRRDGIHVGTPTCWAQGFFIGAGDLASGIFTMFIAIHTFADIVFSIQPPHALFYSAIAICHAFILACSFIAVGMHPSDVFVRAGAWCWVNNRYQAERLWLHYFWILVAEFGTVILYTALFLILQSRLRSGYYATPELAMRAKHAARSIIPYPIIYVVCTLPLASARIASMMGSTPTYAVLVVAGCMITSNGWLDVLLYGLTRRALIFGDESAQQPEMRALDTFAWRSDTFGTTTTISGGPKAHSSSGARRMRALGLRGSSTEELVLANGEQLKVRTEVTVSSTPVELKPYKVRSVEKLDADQKSQISKGSWLKDDNWI